MSDTNALPTPQPSTANLVEIIVPGFIRVNVPKADAEKLYQSLGVTLGHRPNETHMPQQAWDLDARRIEKKIAEIRNKPIEGPTIDSLRTDAKHLQDQIASLRLQLAEARYENSQIQGRLADRTADVNELTGKLRDVQVWMGKSKDENTRLTSSLDDLEKARLDLAGAYKSALEQIDKLKLENAALAASNESANKRAEMEKRAKVSALADFQAEKIKLDKLSAAQWNPMARSETDLACMTIQQQLLMVASSISTGSSPGQLQAAQVTRIGATTIDVLEKKLKRAEQRNLVAQRVEPIRNPEGIDFVKYPIPDGHVVASEEDCKGGVQEHWMVHTESRGWLTVDNPLVCRTAHNEYTYLRPIRADEKPAAGPLAGTIIDHLKEAADNERKIKALRVPHNPENIDIAKHPLPPGYVIASKEEIP